MITPSLNVQGDQIETKFGRSLEQSIFDFIGESHVHTLDRLHDQTTQQGIDSVFLVKFKWFELMLMKDQTLRLASKGTESPVMSKQLEPNRK